VLVFVEGGKTENQPGEKPRARLKPTTTSTHMAVGQNQTWATLVRGKCSYHHTISTP